MLQFLPVFSTVFTGFFHCPGKNTFCHGKNPTLDEPYSSIMYQFHVVNVAKV